MKELIDHIEDSFKKTSSKVTDEILSMQGMSGKRTRHFYNNICSLPGINYLEIGCWKGSSTCSALHGNDLTAFVIDNWSEFGDVQQEFLANIEKSKGNNRFHFFKSESFEMDLSVIPPIDIYLYDGCHSAEAHEAALTYYLPVLKDTFIYIVDDWSWEHPKQGTYAAIEKAGLKTLHKHEEFDGPNHAWWNGIGVFLLSKK